MPIADDADGVRRWERAQDDLVASAQAGSVSASPAAGPMEFLPQVRSPPLPPQTEDHGPSWEAQLEELMLMEAIQLSLREAEGGAGGSGGGTTPSPAQQAAWAQPSVYPAARAISRTAAATGIIRRKRAPTASNVDASQRAEFCSGQRAPRKSLLRIHGRSRSPVVRNVSAAPSEML